MAEFYEGPTGRKRLLRTYETANTTTFDDLFYCSMVTVEDGLIQGGAVPGIDYDRIKLAELAMPLALALMNEYGASITTGIPSSHPHAGLESASINETTAAVLDFLRLRGASPPSTRSAFLYLGKRGHTRDAVIDALCQLYNKGEIRTAFKNSDGKHRIILAEMMPSLGQEWVECHLRWHI